jgi:histidinol-phosphatase (PHP family)
LELSELWKVSLHGGHSGDFCEHGADSLREMLDAAISFGYSTFGVATHSPASSSKFLYEEEVAAGLGVVELGERFREYSRLSRGLVAEYADRIEVLRGAEIEVVPSGSYAIDVGLLREVYQLDYIVGSVHWVDEIAIDVDRCEFDRAVTKSGGLESFLVRYFELVGAMISSVKPEVVGHIDLPRLYCDGASEWGFDRVLSAISYALVAARDAGCILDLNVRAFAKGLSSPFPSAGIVRAASDLGVPFCFGDDSHSVADVGVGVEAGRSFLLANGVDSITTLGREGGGVVKRVVSLV